MTSKLVTRSLGALGLFSALTIAAALPAMAQKSYTVQDKWKVGGEGGWDYLTADSAAHRLYITHGGRVEVLDSTSGKSIGAITGLKGTHGVALDDSGKYGYISDGGANEVVVFDRASLQKVASIPAGTNPDGIAFEPVTKTVWAFNGRSKDVTVIDTATQKVIATVPLPGRPEFPVADGKGEIFDNIEDKNSIVRLDAKAPKVTATWSIAPCESPSGLAIDRAGRRLFAVCDEKKMAVVDANTGKVIATPAIGDGPDAAGYDPKTKLAYSSNGDGTLTVVDASNSSYKVVQNLATQAGARTMALDAATGKVYVVTAQFGPRPAATASNPRPRPSIVADTFTVIVAGRE
ncbi:YncE family protein [Acidicapsa acidisoli]|uniref:YncE family protein n=1 Tax=Acidicapsa acidisoli TaxID=1615681 RepID=UPI0021E0EC69|nr:YncE family protein [Acidicapsa acidisoli]